MSCTLRLNSHLIAKTEFVTDAHWNQSMCPHAQQLLLNISAVIAELGCVASYDHQVMNFDENMSQSAPHTASVTQLCLH